MAEHASFFTHSGNKTRFNMTSKQRIREGILREIAKNVKISADELEQLR
jgi:predicted RNA binding protein YcfA (HicA-like mRNA interferase family)